MDDAGAALVRDKIGDGAMAQTDTDSALRRRRGHRLGQVVPGPAVRAGGGQQAPFTGRSVCRPSLATDKPPYSTAVLHDPTSPAPWLGPLRPRPVPHGPKVIPVKSDASSFLALIRDSSSPLSKAPRCAHKRCLRPSEPLRGRCSPFEPSGPRHGTERLIRGGSGAGCAADLADLAQQLCLGIYRRLAMLGAEGDLP